MSLPFNFQKNDKMGAIPRTNDHWWTARFESMDSDKGVDFAMERLRNSDRPDYEWKLCRRIFQNVYGFSFPIEREMVGKSGKDLPKEYYEWLKEKKGNVEVAETEDVGDVTESDGVCNFIKKNGERCKVKATANGRCRFHQDA